jgi:prepilin-type N-terminal cleavage/methylation domain-containing protein
MGLVVPKLSGFIRSSKNGFSLIELMIVVAIMGIMATIIVPYLSPDNSEQERQEFVSKLNLFMTSVWYNSLTTGRVHRVVIDLQATQMFIEMQMDEKTGQGESKYELVQINYNENFFAWNKEQFDFKDVYINDKNVMFADEGSSDKTWFYIVPDGLAQNVIFNFRDAKESKYLGEVSNYSLVLNPFSVQFKLYESFQKPA